MPERRPEPRNGGEPWPPPPGLGAEAGLREASLRAAEAGRGTGGGSVDETVLAFDFGLKRIGVAIGERRLGTARALATIAAADNDHRFAAIASLLAEWHPARLVVGRPANDDGSAHAMTARCERFAKQLRGRFGLPVDEVDERYTSLEADAALRGAGADWRARKTRVDAEAARLILQDWLDRPPMAHAA